MTDAEKLKVILEIVGELTCGMDVNDFEKGMRAAGNRIKEEVFDLPSDENESDSPNDYSPYETQGGHDDYVEISIEPQRK